jgi:hypothetical protein
VFILGILSLINYLVDLLVKVVPACAFLFGKPKPVKNISKIATAA